MARDCRDLIVVYIPIWIDLKAVQKQSYAGIVTIVYIPIWIDLKAMLTYPLSPK